MDLNQIAKRVTWLDEERRRDKDEIARLQSLLDAQAEEMRDQARHIQELEGRHASVQAQLTALPVLEPLPRGKTNTRPVTIVPDSS